MNVSLFNKIAGSLAILLNAFIYIPITVDIISTGGGYQGWGLLFLPLTFAVHSFLLTGVFAWLKPEIQDGKRVKVSIITMSVVLGLFTLILRRIDFALLFLGLVGLIISKKIQVQQALLIMNCVGALIMIVVKLAFIHS